MIITTEGDFQLYVPNFVPVKPLVGLARILLV